MVVDPVVARGPIHLNIRPAQVSKLVHVQLNSHSQVIAQGVNQADSAIGQLQTSLAGSHRQVIVIGGEQEALRREAVNLNAFQVLRTQAAYEAKNNKQVCARKHGAPRDTVNIGRVGAVFSYRCWKYAFASPRSCDCRSARSSPRAYCEM